MPVDAGLLLSLGGIAWRYRAGKLQRGEEAKLLVSWWGCVLHEVEQNLGRIRDVVANADDPIGETALIDTPYSDVLLGELARLAPAGMQLRMTSELVQRIRQFAWWQDLANQRRTEYRRTNEVGLSPVEPWDTAIAAGRQATSGDSVAIFNNLRELVDDAGRKAFGSEWETVQLDILPGVIEA